MIEPGSFADGVRMLNTRGALVLPGVRLTKKRAVIILSAISEFEHNWNVVNDHRDEEAYNEMRMAMQWIVNQINKRWSQNELYASEVRVKKKKKKSI
jgi:hypothetical protein